MDDRKERNGRKYNEGRNKKTKEGDRKTETD